MKRAKKVLSLILVLTMMLTCGLESSGAVYAKSAGTTNKSKTVQLEKKSVTLAIDGTSTIKVKNAAKAKITYTSLKPAIAKVSGKGKVTAVKPGNTKIKVSVNKSGKKKTLYYNVKVSKPTLKKTSKVYLGDSLSLKVDYLPKKASVKWTSNNSKIAAVNKRGIVTGKKTGKAKITAKVTYKKITYTTTTTVTVKKEPASEKAKRTVSGSSKDEADVYSITALTVDPGTKKAQAIVSAPGNATLTVRFIEESVFFNDSYPKNKSYINGGNLNATAGIAAGSNLMSISADVNGALPENFVAEAVLTDGNGKELCNPFVCIDNTKKHAQFEAKTVNDFDKKRVVNFDGSTNNNFGVLSSDVKKLSAESIEVVYGKSVSDKTYTVKKASAKISAGDKVYIKDKKTEVLFRVKKVTGSQKAYAITPARADDSKYGYSLKEFYEFLKVDLGENSFTVNSASINNESLTPASEDLYGPGVYSTPLRMGGFKTSPSRSLEKSFESSNMSGSVSGKISASANCEYSLGLFGSGYFKFDFTYSTELSAKLSIFAGASNEKEVTIVKAPIPIGITGLDVYADVKAKVKWSASGSIDISGKIKTTNGFKFDSRDGYKPVDKKEFDWNVNAKADAKIEFGPKPSIGVEFLGGVVNANLDAFLGIKGEAKAETSLKKTGDIIHACDLCVDGAIKAFVKVHAELSYNVLDILKGKPIDKDLVSKEWKLFDFYCSLVNDRNSSFSGAVHAGTGKCPNKMYKTMFEALDASEKAVSANISVTDSSGKSKGSASTSSPLYLAPGVYVAKATIGGKEYTTDFSITNTIRTVIISAKGSDSGGGSGGEEGSWSGKVSEIKDAQVGDVVIFGHYEQDNNTANGKEPIEWQVLAKENNRILVVSKYALDLQPFTTEKYVTDITWEKCTLRSWLNNDFINSAFDMTEKSKIPIVEVTADKNPKSSNTPAGNNTKDQIFLLSALEAEKYFPTDELRKCKPTTYTKAQIIAYPNASDFIKGSYCWWWLRSAGEYYGNISPTDVKHNGHIDYCYDMRGRNNAVRPALWINL